MSSLRNAVQRRQHKERAQPHQREKLGLLEKHKDYSLRAKDYAAKKARLRILRQKATDRNPDEFHFAMMSSRVGKDGAKIADRGNKALSHDVVQLLKTQDAGYLRTMANRTKKERERLEEDIQLISAKSGDEQGTKLRALKSNGGSQAGSHTVYVEDREEQRDFDAEDWFETDAEGVWTSYNRPRRDASLDPDDVDLQLGSKPKNARQKEAEFQAWKAKRSADKKHDRQQESLRAKLDAIRQREKSLLLAEQELDHQRAQMSNNVGGVNKNGVKFKVRERKK